MNTKQIFSWTGFFLVVDAIFVNSMNEYHLKNYIHALEKPFGI